MSTIFTALQLVQIAAEDPADFAGVTLNNSEYWFFDAGGQGFFTFDGVTHAQPAANGWFAVLPSQLSSFYFVQADPVADFVDISVENPANSGFIYYPGVLSPSTVPPAGPPIIGITPLDADKNEGNSGSTPFTFTVTRSGLTNLTNSVTWTVGAGPSPSANTADFVGNAFPSGTVTFGPNETTKTVTVNVQGDLTVEPDQNFVVTLSNPTNGAMIDPQHPNAEGVIVNDDVPPPPVLSISALSANKAEGNSGATPFTFTVTRTGTTTGASTATWSVSSGTSPSADGQDFVGGRLPSGIVTFSPGQTSQTITVNVQGDTLYESNENFLVTLANPTGATIDSQRGSAAGVIQNDDALPTGNVVFIDPLDAVKSAGGGSPIPFTFTINRMLPLNATVGSLTVDWAVSAGPGDPIDAAQFFGGQFPTGSVTFSAVQFPVAQQGATVLLYSQTVTVLVQGNINLHGSPEEFTISLTGTSGATRGTSVSIDPQDGSALGFILPNLAIPNDFNADGSSDALWRNSNGVLAEWLMNGSAIVLSGTPTFGGSAVAPDSSWSVAGTGDLNGDGDADMLWRQSTSGSVAVWLMNGSTIMSSASAMYQGSAVAPDSSWSVAGTGDFNGDGDTDILWRQTSTGSLAEWLMNGSAITSSRGPTYQGSAVSPDSSWSVAGIGDFNGDGDADILWRQSSTGSLAMWLMNGSAITSSAALNFQGSAVSPNSSWSIAGIGDFNGDGNADILWRQSTTGSLALWLMNGSTITSSAAPTYQGNAVTPDSTWSIVEVGDFNSGGTSGILWQQSTTGVLVEWQMNGAAITASPSVTSQGSAVAPPSSWQSQARPTDFA